jgi:hypothetical protein
MPLDDSLPQIDDRRYDDIAAEIRTRIARYAPEWRPGESAWMDVNDNDPGITLAQTFAWLAEMLLYRMNHSAPPMRLRSYGSIRAGQAALGDLERLRLDAALQPVFKSYGDILDDCCFAWNKLINMPWKGISIGSREWPYRCTQRDLV